MTSKDAVDSRTGRSGPRRLLAAVGTCLALVCVLLIPANTAYGFWSASSTGTYALASAATLPTVGLSTNSVTATTAALTWTRPFTPTGTTLGQSAGTLSGCPAAPGQLVTSCTASGLTPNTSYTWTLSAFVHNWFKAATAAATTSKQATTTTLSGTAPTTGTAGTSFGVTAAVTGNSGFGTPAGTATFSLYTSSTCAGSPSFTTSAQALTAGAANGSLQPGVGTYYWKANYTPTDSYNTASASACGTAITVTPANGTFAAIGPATTAVGGAEVVHYPAGTSQGDLVLLVVVTNDNGNTKIKNPDKNAWGSIDDVTKTDNPKMNLQTWWRVAGTETSVKVDMKQVSDSTAWVIDYKNMPSPFMGNAVSGVSGSANTIAPSNLTTTAANSLVISLVGIDTAGSLSLSTANGFNLRTSASDGSTNPGRTLGVADRLVTSTGTVTSPSWMNAATSEWVYTTVAFTF